MDQLEIRAGLQVHGSEPAMAESCFVGAERIAAKRDELASNGLSCTVVILLEL